MTPRHVIDLNQLSKEQWMGLLKLAHDIKKHPSRYDQACRGRILATLFFEPSTRTQMSFQTAMLRLGGRIIGFDNPENSSVSKGESLKDTVRVVSGYADLIAMRHPMSGAPKAASLYSCVPIINAGDGGHLHPTQTLTDLFTLYEETGRLDHLCIGCCGDLMYGRTVHSLIKAMSRFEGNSFVLISTPQLGVPQYIKDRLEEKNIPYQEVNTLEEAIPMLDVLYMTRIQQERFASEEEYMSQKGVYVLDGEKLKLAKSSLKILHPLPRVDEITYEVDDDPRAVYFEQTEYGMYARMALMMTLMEQHGERCLEPVPASTHDVHCTNPACITSREHYLPHLFEQKGNQLVCRFCDEPVQE